jgi:hypothetical protein
MKQSCKICDSDAVPFYKGKVLNKYEINYFRCGSCGFIQTENPYWLKEAYSEAIAQLDIGLLDRNIIFSGLVEKLIVSFYPDSKNYLDYGGGYGLFVRRMRDKGFSFYRDDMYCDNLFAKYFDLKDAPVKQFDIVTAFEVFEHLTEPLAEIGKMLALGETIFFSTLLAPSRAEEFDTWWYRAPLSGQHIAFYTMESLKHIANKIDRKLFSNGTSFHILTNAELDENKLKEIFSPPYKNRIKKILKILKSGTPTIHRKSLLDSDYKTIEEIVLNNKK